LIIAIWVVGIPVLVEKNWRHARAVEAERGTRFEKLYADNKATMAAEMTAARESLRALSQRSKVDDRAFNDEWSHALWTLEIFYGPLNHVCIEEAGNGKCPNVAVKADLCALAKSDLDLKKAVEAHVATLRPISGFLHRESLNSPQGFAMISIVMDYCSR
jgi:hypothetical protein